jgi:hypothetical protein
MSRFSLLKQVHSVFDKLNNELERRALQIAVRMVVQFIFYIMRWYSCYEVSRPIEHKIGFRFALIVL